MSAEGNFASMLGGMFANLAHQTARNMSEHAASAETGQSTQGDNARLAAAFFSQLGNVASEVIRSAETAPGSADASDWFSGFQHVVQNFVEEHMEGASQPPTSEAALSSLPVINVTARDLHNCENTECVICLEKFEVGDAATRIPCGHLFHESCVKQWLSNSNQCPVCRFELPTEHEHRRQGSACSRRLRFRAVDLSARSIRELKHLADHLHVDVAGCLDKEDIVQRIVGSGCVDIIPEDSQPEPKAETSNRSQDVPPVLTASQLRTMRVSDLKAEMKRLGICADGCLEKEELVQRVVESGYALAA